MGVVECPDRELELVCVVHERLEVRNRVAVGVYVHLATEHGSQRLPLEILGQIPRDILDTQRLRLIAPVILLPNQLPRRVERLPELPGLAQPTVRPTLAGPPVHALGVLAARHLHVAPVPVRVREHVLGADFRTAISASNCVLDYVGLAADVVSGAGEDEARGHAARFDDLELVVQGLDAIYGANVGGDVVRQLVRVVVALEAREGVHAGVAVHVDDTARQLAAVGIPYLCVIGQRGD